MTPSATRKRTRYVVAAALCVVAVGALLVLGLRGNIIYFRTVSEAVQHRTSEGSHRFRLGGDVVKGSLAITGDGTRFRVTDGKATVSVRHRGDEPAIFRTDARKGLTVPVVCEGRWGPHGVFLSDRILVKHGNDYEPKKRDFESGS